MHTVFDFIDQAARRSPDQPALVDDVSTRVYTYRTLVAEVESVAAGLAERGVANGDRIATVLPNCLEHCLVILALCRLGAVPALMNARLGADELASLVRAGGIQGAVAMPDAEVLNALSKALPDAAPLLCLGAALEFDHVDSFDACRADAAKLDPVPQPDAEDLAFIFYTSGTTGLPKGVMLAHRTTEPRVLWISPMAGVRFGSDLRTLGLAPLSHAIGFHGNFLVTLIFGGTYFVLSQFDPERALQALRKHQVTMLFTVPTFYQAMISAPSYTPDAFASVKWLLWGGAAISPRLLDQLSVDTRAELAHIYGTTETMCTLYHPAPLGQPTRVRPGLYSVARVVAVGGDPATEVAPGEEGELIVATDTDTVFSGYLDQPDATADRVRDGWYFTGDVCRLCNNGDVVLVGRVDDVIRSGGENVHPDEVEAELLMHPGITDVAVVGMADDYWGEIVVAHIVSRDSELDVQSLDAHCRDSSLARFKHPKGYVFADELPRSAANKLLRRLLRNVGAEAVQYVK